VERTERPGKLWGTKRANIAAAKDGRTPFPIFNHTVLVDGRSHFQMHDPNEAAYGGIGNGGEPNFARLLNQNRDFGFTAAPT
jgi:hypothetical protein